MLEVLSMLGVCLHDNLLLLLLLLQNTEEQDAIETRAGLLRYISKRHTARVGFVT